MLRVARCLLLVACCLLLVACCLLLEAEPKAAAEGAEAAAEAYAARLRELGVPTGVGIELATRAIEEPPG